MVRYSGEFYIKTWLLFVLGVIILSVSLGELIDTIGNNYPTISRILFLIGSCSGIGLMISSIGLEIHDR